MTIATNIINRLEIQVFNKLGSDGTLVHKGTPTYNDYDEITGTTGDTTSTIKFVPYNLIEPRGTYNSFGDLQEGESDAVIPYNTTISIDDTISYGSDTYLIRQIEDYVLQNTTVAYVIRLYKQI